LPAGRLLTTMARCNSKVVGRISMKARLLYAAVGGCKKHQIGTQ
jgi:hypothetical protein